MAPASIPKLNPYVIGVPIHDPARLYGREALFEFVADNLGHGAQTILLHGWRRIGKSSVLRQIPHFVAAGQFAFVYFDLQEQARRPVAEVLLDLAEEIRLALELGDVPGPDLEPLREEPEGFSRIFLPWVLEQLAGRTLVLLLDEFDVLERRSQDAAVEQLFPLLGAAVQQHARLRLICVVGRRPAELPQLLQLFKGAPHREIGLLPPRSARRMVTEPTAGALEYSEEALSAIQSLSAGHPYCTQLVCHELFARAREWNDWTVEPEDVIEIVDLAIESGTSGLAWYLRGLPPDEGVLFTAIAHWWGQVQRAAPGAPPAAQPWALLEGLGAVITPGLRSAEERLVEWGFLRPAADTAAGYPYELAIELVRRWLEQQHPLKREVMRLADADPEATRIYAELRSGGSSPSAGELVEPLRAVVSRNPNHFPALIELGEAVLELGRFAEAADYLGRALLLDPGRVRDGLAQALLEVAGTHLQHGEPEPALAAIDRAVGTLIADTALLARAEEARGSARRLLGARNPFAPGQIRFEGREKELWNLFSAIQSGEAVWVVGEHGVGKSALLHALLDRDVWAAHSVRFDTALVLLVNCELLPEPTWQALGSGLLSALRTHPSRHELELPAAALAEENSLDAGAVRAVLEAVLGQRQVVVLLDDYDTFLRRRLAAPEELWAKLFGPLIGGYLRQTYRTAVVMTSHQVWDEAELKQALGFPSPRGAAPLVQLRPLDPQERAQMIARTPAPLAWSAKELAWLDRVAGGFPGLLQPALSLLYERKVLEQPFSGNAAATELSTKVEGLLERIWDAASESERGFLALLASSTAVDRLSEPSLPRPSLEMAVRIHLREWEALRERGLLQGTRIPELFSSLFEWWLVKRIEELKPDELPEWQERLGKAAGTEAAPGFRSLLQWLWEQKPAFHRIEAWCDPGTQGDTPCS
jgi:tetratricopeptide (TPR) repeat protein